jgi:hypothetical protein
MYLTRRISYGVCQLNYLKELMSDRLLVAFIIGSSIAAIYVRGILYSIFGDKFQVPKRAVIIQIVHCVKKLDELSLFLFSQKIESPDGFFSFLFSFIFYTMSKDYSE